MSARFMPDTELKHAVETENEFYWQYVTDEFEGICELAGDKMVVKCNFVGTGKKFYDVLMMDGIIRAHLCRPVSVERLADNLAAEFPDLQVTVSGRAKTHGWITAAAVKRWPA